MSDSALTPSPESWSSAAFGRPPRNTRELASHYFILCSSTRLSKMIHLMREVRSGNGGLPSASKKGTPSLPREQRSKTSHSLTEFKTAQSRVSYTNLRLRVDDFLFEKSIPFSNRIQNRSVQSVIYQPSRTRRRLPIKSLFSNRIQNRSVQSVIYQPSLTRRRLPFKSYSVTEFKNLRLRVVGSPSRVRIQ
jgi:hypothetical protein